MNFDLKYIREKLDKWEETYELPEACRKEICKCPSFETKEAEILRKRFEKKFTDLFDDLEKNKETIRVKQEVYVRGGDYVSLSEETLKFEEKRKNLEREYFALLEEIIFYHNAFDLNSVWFDNIKRIYQHHIWERLEKIKKIVYGR